MNDQEEKILRQSQWSGRRIVLFYWFTLVFLGTSAAAGLGTTILLPNYKIEADPNHDGITDPWGPDDCVGCHPGEVAGWETTWHAQLVGEYDPTDPTLNGSRMSYNSTHFWRTPKTLTNISDPTDISNIMFWTYNQIFNASGQQCCMTTRWTNTTIINATTGEVLWSDDALVAQYGGNIWDIGISCAACHANPGEFSLSYTVCYYCHMPGGRQYMGLMGSAHYDSLSDLLASSNPETLQYANWSYVGQSTYMSLSELDESDYYGITCVTCHDPHNATINAGDDSDFMSPWTNPYTNQVFGPGGRQLRAATINDLCGICHDVNLNTTTGSYLDPSDHGTLDCTDCHGYTYTPAVIAENGTVLEFSSVSSLSHDWKFDFGETGCGVCHNESATTVYTTMLEYQEKYVNLTSLREVYDIKLLAAITAYEIANATDGADVGKLANAKALIEEAKDLAQGSSLTFHNPEIGLAIEEEQLSLALTKLDYAFVEAITALPEETTTTEPVTTTTTEPVTTTTTEPVTTTTTEPVTTTTTEPVTTTTTEPVTTTTVSTSEEVTTEETSDTTTESIPTINITTGFSIYLIVVLVMILTTIKRGRKN